MQRKSDGKIEQSRFETNSDLWSEHYQKLVDKLEEWGLCGELKGESVPREVWAGLLQPVADLSGYRIVLQAQSSEANTFKPLYVDVAVATPSIFWKQAEIAVSNPAAAELKRWNIEVPTPRNFGEEPTRN